MSCRGPFQPQLTCYSLKTLELLPFSGQTRLWPGSQFFPHNWWYMYTRATPGVEHHLPVNRCWCRQELILILLLKTSVNNASPAGSTGIRFTLGNFRGWNKQSEEYMEALMQAQYSWKSWIGIHCLGLKPWVSSEKSCLKFNTLGKKSLAKIPFLISLTLIVVLAVF